jgi:hypothetical protein
MDHGLKIVLSSYGSALLLWVVVIMFLLWIIPIVFISLLLLLSYKIVSKINHKEVAANIKPFPILLIRI